MKIIQACKQKCPWWLKVTLKMILYRLPVSQKFWRFFGVFEPGAMANCEYAYNQFHSHFKATKQTIQAPFTSLELGPGDSLFSGLVANALGAEKCWLINSGDLAIDDPTSYKAMINFLADKGYQTPDILVNANISEFLNIYNITYLTEGLQSLCQVPDNSVDLIHSQAVLEHVRVEEMQDLLSEFKRVLKPSGIMSHTIDLQDHLDHALNNLRFSKEQWEGKLFRGSGFYTNRIRHIEMMDMFEKAGFVYGDLVIDRWDQLPTPRKYLNQEFLQYSDEELCIRGFSLTLQHVAVLP